MTREAPSDEPDWRAKCEEMENALALAQYEARRWKEKFAVERQRRRKIARDLLEFVVLADRRAPAASAEDERPVTRPPSLARSGLDHLGNILSPTLSSFDFDDDSSDVSDLDSGGSDSDLSPATAAFAAAAVSGADAVSSALEMRDRQSMLFHAHNSRSGRGNGDYVFVRPNRSSTTGSVLEARRGSAANRRGGAAYATLPSPGSPTTASSPTGSSPQSLMYRILYAKPTSRDLWHTKSQSARFHNVARSIMFSMHLKKEHVFEHFFVVGAADNDVSRCLNDAGESARVCKPRILYEYPQRGATSPDGSAADFCFPLGVPLIECTREQAAALSGAVISRWSTDADQLQKHILEPFRTSGYTFRLTGAKGEVLYGFCAAVMKQVHPRDPGFETQGAQDARSPPSSRGKAASPVGDRGKRASFPARKRLSDGISPRAESPRRRRQSKRAAPGNESESAASTPDVVMAPVCFCFTSKFPFYRLHFSLLRMLIENELDEGRFMVTPSTTRDGNKSSDHGPSTADSDADEEYEVILRSKIELGVAFSILHQENTRQQHLQEQQHAVSSSDSFTSGLGSVASAMNMSMLDNRALLSEDGTLSTSAARNAAAKPERSVGRKLSYPNFRRSHSTDDIDSYNVTNAWVVDKPMVKRCPETLPDEYRGVQVGDVLEAIDGYSTASMSFEDAMEMVEHGERPMRLRFRRPALAASSPKKSASAVKSVRNPHLTSTSIDVLHCARRLKINDPGHWSTARLPNFSLNYQLPKRHSERWACGVVLRFLSAESVVKIVAHLLLERQVVIMGDSPAKVTAVCAAMLLLIAPFQWQSTYIPLLPSGLLDFLHSPVPFLAGCHVIENTDEWPDVCFYDIDDDRVVAPAESRRLSQSSLPNGVELCNLLRTAKERFAALRTTGRPWYEMSDEEDKIVTLTLQESEIFLRDLGFDISSQDLAASLSEGKSFYDRLQEEVAKEVRKSAYEDYLEEFSQTQLFCQYYESLLQVDPDGKKL